MKFNQRGIFYILAALVFLLNFTQAFFTELIYDESYYWYYARELSWGYFDHPPMVAFMIWLGGHLFDGELGVRFVSTILSAAGLFVLWDSIDHPSKKDYVPHFFLLVFSMTLLNVYGFFALPDTPLLFFLAVFLWTYKKYLAQPGLKWAVCLGLVMALLMYSKYHAALIIIFVLLSNLRLIRDKFAWLAVLVALLFYSPHLIWLYEHDFVTIKYHIFERPNRAYEFGDFTLGFFLNLVVLFGLTFPWVYRSLFKTKTSDQFTKALLYIVYGFIIFFFVSSFNRRIQTQWLVAISIPMVLIVYQYMLADSTTRKWIMRAGLANAVIFLFLRIGLAYAPLFPVHYESHGNKEWVENLKNEVGDMPVVFVNSYRRAPMYEFYSGSTSYSLNNIWYRQNQFSIDESENEVRHKDVLYVAKAFKQGDLSFELPVNSRLYGNYIEHFESFRKLRCLVRKKDGDSEIGSWELEVHNPYDFEIPLSKLGYGLAYLNKYKQVREVQPLEVRAQNPEQELIGAGESVFFNFKLPLAKELEPAYFKVAISENGLPYGLNGTNIKLNE